MSQITKFAVSSGPGSGTVTSISAGHDITLTPNPITTTGTVAVDNVITLGDLALVTAGNPSVTLTSGDLTISGTGVGAAGNINLPVTSSANVGVITAGSTPFIHNYDGSSSASNVFIGLNAGNFTMGSGSGTQVGIGQQALSSITSGVANTAIGTQAAQSMTTGQRNYIMGNRAMPQATSASSCVAIGFHCLEYSNGSFNIGIGERAGATSTLNVGLLTGQYNVLLGYMAGNAMTGAESSDIYISNPGVSGESNTIRLGTSGSGDQQQNQTFIAGINGNTVSNTKMVTINSSTDQLGTADMPSSSITITGDTGGGLTGNSFTFDAVSQAGSSVSFSGAGTTISLNTSDSNENVIIGNNSGNGSVSGFGNTSVGTEIYTDLSSGNYNQAFGIYSAVTLASGSNNISIGARSGENWNGSESNNILIASDGAGTNSRGVTGDNNILRIGGGTGTGAGQQNQAFISGINGTTSTGTTVVINSSDQLTAGGIATNSSQPAFLAVNNADQNNVTGDGTQYTVTFVNTIFDQNSNFDGTSTFTAPVRGFYAFYFGLYCTGITVAHANDLCWLATTAGTYRVLQGNIYPITATGGTYVFSGSFFVNMSAGDTATVVVDFVGGTKVITLNGVTSTGFRSVYFGGYLVC